MSLGSNLWTKRNADRKSNIHECKGRHYKIAERLSRRTSAQLQSIGVSFRSTEARWERCFWFMFTLSVIEYVQTPFIMCGTNTPLYFSMPTFLYFQYHHSRLFTGRYCNWRPHHYIYSYPSICGRLACVVLRPLTCIYITLHILCPSERFSPRVTIFLSSSFTVLDC